MNSARFKDEEYEFRPVRDLKDMLNSSAVLYAERNAFLVKNAPGGPYVPITYKQLKINVDELGTAFADLGLSGKKIAVIGENRYEWVITYLAAVNGGSIIVPLDRELPAPEIRHLLERSDVSAIVYSSKVESVVQEAVSGLGSIKTVVSMDAIEHSEDSLSLKKLLRTGKKLILEGNHAFLNAEIDREAMCALLFTSGTTGLAKGVMLSHKNITANVVNMSKYVDVSNGKMVGLSVLPMHHTYEMTCHVLTCLYQGCAIAICEGLKHIVKNMAEAKATVMLGVPLIFESMHKKVWKTAEANGKAEKMRKAILLSRKLEKFNIKSMRKLFKAVHQAMGGHMQLFISGAAAIDPIVIEDFNAMGMTMFQGYGMTENAPIIAVNKDRYYKAASVGLPMPGTEIRIVDEDENGIGEVICRGDSVMLGYYDDPEETARTLVDGWLHTGDYGYFDEDGFLYISGRKKNVIVTKNGKNIFPEEVELYLSKCEYIAEVVVRGLEDEKSGDTVVQAEIYPAYGVIEQQFGEIPAEESLRRLIKKEIDRINEQMPLYKRVKRFTIRDQEFEKTTSKKIKRFASK